MITFEVTTAATSSWNALVVDKDIQISSLESNKRDCPAAETLGDIGGLFIQPLSAMVVLLGSTVLSGMELQPHCRRLGWRDNSFDFGL